MRPFVLITDHPSFPAVVAPVIAAVGCELRVATTWAEGMAIEHHAALAYLNPFPISDAVLAQHPTPLLLFVPRGDPQMRVGSHPPGGWIHMPRHISFLVVPFDPVEVWMRIVRAWVPEHWQHRFPVFPPMDHLWADILAESRGNSGGADG